MKVRNLHNLRIVNFHDIHFVNKVINKNSIIIKALISNKLSPSECFKMLLLQYYMKHCWLLFCKMLVQISVFKYQYKNTYLYFF